MNNYTVYDSIQMRNVKQQPPLTPKWSKCVPVKGYNIVYAILCQSLKYFLICM